jgi:hypothetical protein
MALAVVDLIDTELMLNRIRKDANIRQKVAEHENSASEAIEIQRDGHCWIFHGLLVLFVRGHIG